MYRGFQIGTGAPLSHVRGFIADSASWGVNVIRWPIGSAPEGYEHWSEAQYDAWFNWMVDKLEACAVTAKLYGIKLIVCIANPVGGRIQYGSSQVDRLFIEKWAKKAFRRHWRELADRFESNPAILAYDILNEPHPKNPGQWNKLAKTVVKQIRKRDKKTPIIVASQKVDPKWFKKLKPIKNKGEIWYECHMYWPMDITHQGIQYPIGVAYPHPELKKKHLRERLEPVRKFQLKHYATIYVGEFSCSIVSGNGMKKNAPKYLAHCIQLFEEYGWHWTYHAVKEAPIWNPEDNQKTEALLKKKFSIDDKGLVG